MLHFVQQVEQQGGLAHSRLCDQGGKSAPCFDRINQRCEGFRMGWTEIQIPRIGSDTEWLLAEPKIFQQPGLAAGFSFVIDGWHTIVLDTSCSNELAELDSPAWIGRWPSGQRPPPPLLTHGAGINLNRPRSSQHFHGNHEPRRVFFSYHECLHISLMVVTRMERVPPNAPLLIVAVFLFPVHKASPLESQAEFPPLARSNSRTGFVGKIPFCFTVLPGPVQKIQLVANGFHRQLA